MPTVISRLRMVYTREALAAEYRHMEDVAKLRVKNAKPRRRVRDPNQPRPVPSGWQRTGGIDPDTFWFKETRHGLKYRCKTCSHETLGYSGDKKDMHTAPCVE